MTKTTFQMLCNKNSPLLSQVIPLQKVTLLFFDVHGGVYSANVFTSPIIRIKVKKQLKRV